ncbi:MAG: hypothetical protein JWP12_598 [Bacteroidetes bacterium]|nr:hypothetical protein [Bacteroidota bacterium]
MKKIYLLILTVCMCVTVNAQWVILPTGTSDELEGIDFPSVNIGYATSANGNIFKTINGGSSWVMQTSGTAYSLYGVDFTSVDTGYCVGLQGRILKTTDGGANWVPQTSGTPEQLTSVRFLNSNVGYAGCNNGTILKTTNGGASWVIQTILGNTNSINSIWIISPDTVYAVGHQGTFLETVDGGINWFSLPTHVSQTLSSLCFLDKNNGYVVGASLMGNDGVILKTTNGGANWTSTNFFADYLVGVSFTNPMVGYVAGGNGLILKTTDGGTSWVSETSGTTGYLFSICFSAPGIAYIAGDGGIVVTNAFTGISEKTTGNASFSVYPNPFESVATVAFTDEQNNSTIRITDLAGREIKAINFSGKQLELQKDELTAGVYFIQVETKKGIQTRMVVIR